MSIHDDIQDKLPGYALGALDPEEAARVNSHLNSCKMCAHVLADYQPVAAALAFSVPMADPPRDLKARTLQYALRRPNGKSGSIATDRRQTVRPRSWFAPALLGAALVIAVIALTWSAWQGAELGRQIQTQRDLLTAMAYTQGPAQVVRGTEIAPQAVGRLYLDPDSSVAALVTVNMPPLGNNRTYQAWLTTADGNRLSGGVFQLDDERNGLLLIRATRDLSNVVQVGVTDEPAGGSPSPTTKPVLLAKVSAH